MGLVTSIAGHTAGVLSSHDLGKSGGFGGIFLMAAAAEGGDIGPTLYSLGEAYRSPSFHSVGQLAVCVEAFLRMRT